MDGLSFVIRDRNDVFERLVVAHRGAEADLVWNGPSSAFFVLDDSDVALPAILAEGARCDVWFNGVEEFRGWVSATPGAGPFGHVTAYVEDFRQSLDEWQGWPKPTAAITAQTDEFRAYSGPLETVVKTAVGEAVTRLGWDWVIAPSLGRGPSTKINFRFDYLGDLLWQPLKDARYGLVLSYPGGVPTLDLRSPETVPGVLDVSSGRVDSFDFSRRAPAATRVAAGGRGEGIARELDTLVDVAREAAWGRIKEVWVDARNNDVGADLTPEAQTVLDDGAPSTSVSLELTEQPGFKLHSTYEVGDLVLVKVGDLESTEVITKVLVKDDPDSGVTVTPTVGDVVQDEIQLLADQVSRLQKRARTQGRR